MIKLYLGVGGLARSGKDLYCKIASNILTQSGYTVKKYAFADTLKNDVKPFLWDCCGVNVWTDDTETKTDIRDFLVWYGTTFWRKRDPNKWINKIEESIGLESNLVDIVFVSDVRYPNEADWIHKKNGFLVHISKFVNSFGEIKFQKAPNKQEEINDPIVKSYSDSKIEWLDLTYGNTVKVDIDSLIDNIYLKEIVLKSLQLCPGLSLKF